jgi:catecholate siderophore receptor
MSAPRFTSKSANPSKRHNLRSHNPSSQPSTLLPLGAMMLAGVTFAAHAQTQTSAADQAVKQSGAEAQIAAVKVDPVEVLGHKEHEAYLVNKTRVGKTLQDPHDVPQAVTSLPRLLLEDQQVGQLREAMRNVSGLTFNAAEGGRSGDNMMLRGFYTFGDMYLDGIRDTAQYNRETFNLEQIDVLRGSAAMLFGRGQAGGVINQVSKTAFLFDKNSVTASGGTDEYRQFTADLNKKLGADAALRVNAMQRDEGSWRSNPVTGTRPEQHRKGVALNFGYGLGTGNEFSLSYVGTSARDNADYGLSFDPTTHRVSTKFAASTFWGIDGNFYDSDSQLSTLIYTHRFANRAEWRTQVRYADYSYAYWASAPSATVAPGAFGNAPKVRRSDTRNVAVQSDYSQKFSALGMKHELLAGVEYLDEDSVRWPLVNLGTTAAPLYTIAAVGPAITYQGKSKALFAQESVEFVPDWKATLGVRRDQLTAEYSSLTSPRLEFGENSWRAGLSWQPSDNAHYYVSTSDSFSPTADLYQLSGGAYPAERGKVLEAGAKFMLLDGDLAVRTALYRADKVWERNTDLESTAAVLTRKRRTDGIEFEIAGRITPKWEVFSGLALMRTKILEVAENRNAATGAITFADPRLTGQRARNTPPYTFNLWSTYKITDAWKVGGGVETKGRRYVYSPSTTNADNIFTNGQFTPNTAPAYVRWDAMIAYERPTWALRLNVKNMFNKLYYDALYDNGGFAVPGTRRTAILTAEYKF